MSSSMWYSKILSSSSLYKGPDLYSAKNEKTMALFHIKNFSCTFKRNIQHAGHKWVTCGSHLDCSVGQWVKWVNRCDPLLNLDMQTLTDVQGLITCSITSAYTASDKALFVS